MKAHPHAPVAFFFFALAPAFAQGQEPAEQAIVLEEIIVTAALRELALQDTPMSLGVLTGCDLRDIGAISIDDVWRNIPNLAVRDSPFGGRSLIIRGLFITNLFNERAELFCCRNFFDPAVSPARTAGLRIRWTRN